MVHWPTRSRDWVGQWPMPYNQQNHPLDALTEVVRGSGTTGVAAATGVTISHITGGEQDTLSSAPAVAGVPRG